MPAGPRGSGHSGSFYTHYWGYREQSNCFRGDNAVQEFAALYAV